MKVKFTLANKSFSLELEGIDKKYEMVHVDDLAAEICENLEVVKENSLSLDYNEINELEGIITFVLVDLDYQESYLMTSWLQKQEAIEEFKTYIKDNYRYNSDYAMIDTKTLEVTKFKAKEVKHIDIEYLGDSNGR